MYLFKLSKIVSIILNCIKLFIEVIYYIYSANVRLAPYLSPKRRNINRIIKRGRSLFNSADNE
uniref:Uncharacterized protein n=1 Tax=Meloidogyne enterolobii TaxID=390850 RepID=A0A6V7UYX3_MELEN|nr:unnamed protein product [Meloidogyne enterolobii]